MKNTITIKEMIYQYQEYSETIKAPDTVRYQESYARGWIKFLKAYNIKYPYELNKNSLKEFRLFARKT